MPAGEPRLPRTESVRLTDLQLVIGFEQVQRPALDRPAQLIHAVHRPDVVVVDDAAGLTLP
jgi:hypothetical protein